MFLNVSTYNSKLVLLEPSPFSCNFLLDLIKYNDHMMCKYIAPVQTGWVTASLKELDNEIMIVRDQ